MISNTIGKLGFRYRGAYVGSTTYELQDVVEYNGSTYIHTAASSTSPPTTSNWQMLSESTQSISGTANHLIVRDSSTLTTMPSGTTGQILTSTSKNIYTRTVTVNSTPTPPQYEFDGDPDLPDLVEGDQLILNVDISISPNNPIVFGKDTSTLLTSADGVRYIINDLQFNTADDYVNYVRTHTPSSWQIIFDVPEDYTSTSSTLVWSDYDAVVGGNVAGNFTDVYDSGSSPNSIVLKWKDYPNESPRKVARFPDNVHCNTKNFAAFVMMDGSIRTIGTGDTYRHGNGTADDREQPSLVGLPKSITGISSFILGPDTGLNYLIDTSGKLWVWGQAYVGESGNPSSAYTYKVPTDITSSAGPAGLNSIQDKIDSVGVTVLDVCEILPSDNTNKVTLLRVKDSSNDIHLIAAGYNNYGQLGVVNNITNQNIWKKVTYGTAPTSPIASIIGTAGDTRTFFAIDTAGEVYSWGSNYYGTLGTESSSDYVQHYDPKKITSFANPIQKLVVGPFSAYAIDSTNDLFTWGRNSYGNLGLGDAVNRSEPEMVMEDVANVFTNGFDNDVVFVLKTDGTLLSGGDGSYGATGQGTTGDLQTYIPVTKKDGSTIENVVKVAIGGTDSRNSSAILTTNGSVYTCGFNGKGQLGLGDKDHREHFEEVPIQKHIIDIQWFGSEMDTVLALLTDEHDVFICGSGIEGLNTEYSGNMRLVPTPIIF